MSVAVEQPVGEHNKVQGTGNGPDTSNGNSITQLSVGPAALAQLMILRVLSLYGEISELQLEQKKNMVKAQSAEAKGAYQETLNEGDAALSAALWAGGLTIGGAALGLAAMLGTHLIGMKEISKEQNKIGQEGKPMETLKEHLSEPQFGLGAGDPAGGGYVRPEVKARMEEFSRGNYSNAKENDPVTREAVRRLKVSRRVGGRRFDYAEWETQFEKRMDLNAQRLNTCASKLSSKSNMGQVISQGITSGFQGGSSIAQGKGQKATKEHQAAAQLETTSSQMAGSSSSDLGQAAAKAYEAEVQEVQILEKIHQTNSVNG